MSAFDPSVLDNKDRDELSQIAEQLGKKPPARAKKADIVALILQLAGVAPDLDATAPGEPAEAVDASPAPSDADADTDNGSGSDEGVEVDAGPAADAGPDGVEAPSSPSTAPRASAAPPSSGPGRDGRGPGRTPPPPAGANSPNGRGGGRDGAARRPFADTPPSRANPNGGPQREAGPSSSNPGQGGQPSGGSGNGGNGNGGNGNGNGGGSEPGTGPNAATNAPAQPQNPNHRPNQPEDSDAGNRRRRRRGRGAAEGGEETFQGDPVEVAGLLDLRDEGYGFLRLKGYLPSHDDVYVSVKQVRQFALRKGDHVVGKSRPASRNEKNPALLQIDGVNGGDPEEMKGRPRFEDLTPLFPDERLVLERKTDALNMTARIIDLVSPIGKGQRGLIVSPPKAGKTSVMKEIARSIETNHPEVQLIVLLVDERPEEVTDMKRWLHEGEVAASTFDRPSDEHIQVAELVIERAKRLVEEGKDVVIIVDGITRLARAYNLAAPGTGRIMSGGIDTGALYPPKKFFGAGRNVEEGGSLTILATALVETGSRMDEVIFEEFKGTGNLELKLDRRIADRRIFPAIDVEASSTRREDLLFTPKQLQQVWKLRRVLAGLKAEEGASSAAGLELLIDRMRSFKSNDAFLTEIGKA